MKSILIEKPNQLAIVEREIPTPSAGEVRVKVKLAGICGSDSHIYRGHNPFAKYPRVIGHEFFGVIDAVGDGVESARVGERVAVDPVVSCGHCYPCSIGKPNVCTTLAVLGVHADGGFSEYAVVPAKNAWKIPEAVADQYAVMIEPFTIAANVTGHGQPTENDTVLVYGAGPIGLTIVQVLKGVYNVKNVIVADRIDERLEKAKESGADRAINNSQTPLGEIFAEKGIKPTPVYDRNNLAPRIIHLGFGAFHRAHQGVYADILATEHFSDWGYYEVNLIGGEQQIADLQQQDNLYTVAEMSADAWTARVVGVVKKALHVQMDGLETVLAAMCEPQIAIVSLTITEKGYFHSPATGQLMLDHPMVAADVQNPHQPKTATGVIVEALARRKAAGLPAFTVMSCDNMPENGHVMRDVVTSYAKAVDEKLAQWIEDNVTFPSTMVDRIVPAVTEDTLAKIEQLTGVGDPAGVACEPFRQWVIEDNFVAGRPEWEKAGAELVSDVLPYEEMKLRMLNGSHSFLAYLGYLAGYQHINDCMEDEHYRYAAYGLMLQEQAPTLKVQGVDLQDYANRLIARYSNPALRHRTWQIAMDGSQKLPQRMLDSVRWHLAHDSKFDLLALGVAGWMRYVGGVDEQGNPIEISDPLLPVIQKAVQSSAEGKARVQSLLAIKAIFGDDLPDNSLFTAKVTEAYLSLLAHGAKATVAKYSVK